MTMQNVKFIKRQIYLLFVILDFEFNIVSF